MTEASAREFVLGTPPPRARHGRVTGVSAPQRKEDRPTLPRWASGREEPRFPPAMRGARTCVRAAGFPTRPGARWAEGRGKTGWLGGPRCRQRRTRPQAWTLGGTVTGTPARLPHRSRGHERGPRRRPSALVGGPHRRSASSGDSRGAGPPHGPGRAGQGGRAAARLGMDGGSLRLAVWPWTRGPLRGRSCSARRLSPSRPRPPVTSGLSADMTATGGGPRPRPTSPHLTCSEFTGPK